MNLSFAGCGFLGIYHVGVAVCFKKYAPHLLLEKIGGASAGSLAAACLLCDLPLDNMTSDFFRVVKEARRHALGPFSPLFNIQTCLMEGLQKHLPVDAHKRVSGRLHISLTRVSDNKNVIISEFSSREEVLDALLCACFIPGFSGLLPPRFRGVRYMDGAFSDNLPILDENTITVSPFCGESDICPRDQSSQLFHIHLANMSIEISRQNINRFVRILYPPGPEYLSQFCQQGFDDALQFLHRNNLINCRRCIAVQSTFVVSENATLSTAAAAAAAAVVGGGGAQNDDNTAAECSECKEHRQNALNSNMPQTVLDAIQVYIEQANNGLMSWFFKHRGVKLLSLPAVVPFDFFLATVNKVAELTPIATKKVMSMVDETINEIQLCISDKLTLCEPPHFDATNFLRSESAQLEQVNAEVDKCIGTTPVQTIVDDYEQMLRTATQTDALYSYYYTNEDDEHRVKITELFNIDDNAELAAEFKDVYKKTFERHISAEWDTVEADFFIEEMLLEKPTVAATPTELSPNGGSTLKRRDSGIIHEVYDLSDEQCGAALTDAAIGAITRTIGAQTKLNESNLNRNSLCIEVE